MPTKNDSTGDTLHPATGMSEGLVRISVGIEDWRDLLADFHQALNDVSPPLASECLLGSA